MYQVAPAEFKALLPGPRGSKVAEATAGQEQEVAALNALSPRTIFRSFRL